MLEYHPLLVISFAAVNRVSNEDSFKAETEVLSLNDAIHLIPH